MLSFFDEGVNMSFSEIVTKIVEISGQLPDNVIYIIRILIAAVCGGLIGLERSKRQKEAGIRTHIIVCLGAALMMIVSKYAFFDVISIPDARISVDASRIAANIITGISFLGAGVIFVKDASIKGLTTAAGIWATSGVGMAVGAGMEAVGIVTTGLIIFLQIFLHKYAAGLESTFIAYVKIHLKNENKGCVERLIECMNENHIEVINQKVRRRENYYSVLLSVKIPQNVNPESISLLVEEDEDIISIEV